MPIPEFAEHGGLPPGIHAVGWAEFEQRFGASPKRKRLLRGLGAALQSLSRAGCRKVWIDGSFVTNKLEPNDFDGCWDPSGVDPSKLDPVLMRFEQARRAQKLRFGGELFPSLLAANREGDTYLEFFQTDSDGNAKGIVEIDIQGMT